MSDMINGTHHFIDYKAAITYYRTFEENPREVVRCKLNNGEIKLGPPPVKSGERLITIDDGNRYAVETLL